MASSIIRNSNGRLSEHSNKILLPPNQRPYWKLSLSAVLIIFTALFFRFYCIALTPVVDSDGALYIQQAKALFYSPYQEMFNCSSYFSCVPIFIAFAYKVLGDWVMAARGISILFGTLTLIPLYWLLRRFFDETISSLTLLVFVLIPSFVTLSQDIICGPIYWFLALLGIYFFILQIDKKNYRYLFFSGLLFLLGSWVRIECCLYILISAMFLLFNKGEQKLVKLLFFILPFIIAGIIMDYLLFIKNNSMSLFDLTRILNDLSSLILNYKKLSSNLGLLADHLPAGVSPFFFQKVQDLTWLIGLATALNIIQTTFYLPFFITLMVGMQESKRRQLKDPRLNYLSYLYVAAFFVLYAQILYNWSMEPQFVALFLLPAFIFIGFGIEKISHGIQNKFRVRKKNSFLIIGVMIFLLVLPKISRKLKTNNSSFSYTCYRSSLAAPHYCSC